MARPQIQERSAYQKTFHVKDDDGNLVMPSNLRYRIDCVTSQSPVLGWVVVTAASSVPISVSSELNLIVNDANDVETKRITVQANYGLPGQIVGVHEYDVLNSRFYA